MRYIWAAVGGLAFSAQAEVVVIPLQHRTAEEVLPLVRPLLSSEGAATGMNTQLILRDSSQNLAEIQKILPTLDAEARRLLIWVRQGVSGQSSGRQEAVSGSVTLGRNARFSVNPPPPDQGGLLQAGSGNDGIQAQWKVTKTRSDDDKLQQVQVLEGHLASIRVGQSIPVIQRQRVQSGGQIQEIERLEYREVISGFQVLPRLTGDAVTLEIWAQNDQAGANLRTQQLLTTVRGRPGEWLSLGGQDQQSAQSSKRIGAVDDQAQTELRGVQLKVEVLP